MSAGPKTAIVTGAAGGIGLEIARGLTAAGMRVIAGCRDAKKATVGEGWTLDLARLSSVRAFAARVETVDVIVCNAAVWPGPRRRTADGYELAFGVNHLAHVLLVGLLRDKLAPAARIVVVASGLHARGELDWDDLQMERRYDSTGAYARSKLANVMFALTLARRGFHANACHPGVVATGLLRHQPPGRWDRGPRLSPAQGARGPLHLALVETANGRYFDGTRMQKPAPRALDRAAQDRLWDISEKLVGL